MGNLRVQSLATCNLKELPTQFIRPFNERPENTVAVEGISLPTISMAQAESIVVEKIREACIEWGFFILTEHDIPISLMQNLQEVGVKFFELPQEEKESYSNDSSNGKMEGYGTKMTKNLDDKVEWIDYFFHIMYPPNVINYEIWPKNPPSYKKVTEEYNNEMVRISTKIMRMLSLGLGLKEDLVFGELGGKDIEYEMKINMYPPCPQPHLVLGVEPHTDMSALTILLPNDVPGLQVWKDEKWVAVDYIPHALYVHVGDQLEVLSNGKFKSVLHRSVVNKERTRMSWAVFVAPPSNQTIGPLEELIDDHNQKKFFTNTYKDYREKKFNKLVQ